VIAAAVAGLTVAVSVAVFSETGAHPTARMARCSMGFLVAIVWIMAIADEVVQVLQVGFFLLIGPLQVLSRTHRHLALFLVYPMLSLA
jgi:hypothetical protein